MNQEYEDYRKQRKAYSEARQASQEKYDRTIASVSGGAFGLSLIAINIILSHGSNILCREFIVLAWWSFGISIGLVTISHFLSEKAHREAIQELDNKSSDSIDKVKNTSENTVEKLSEIIKNLNVLSGIFFAVGVTLFLVFASCNILLL